MKNSHLIGIDLGATNIRLGLVSSKGVIGERRHSFTDVASGSKMIIQNIALLANELIESVNGNVSAIGIDIPGQVSPTDGSVRFAPNLHWEDVPLKEQLTKLTKLPVAVTNDVRAATWGEWKLGAGQGCNHLACVFIGTGVGGGFVSSGQIVDGYNNCAGELGHMIIQMDGPLCSCGNRGCLEAVASGWAIAKAAHAPSAKTVVEAYHNKDAAAEKIIVKMFDALTAGCINVVNMYNPERLILGGGVLSGLPEAIVHVQMGVLKQALQAATKTLDILPGKLAGDAGTIGAAVFAKETITCAF